MKMRPCDLVGVSEKDKLARFLFDRAVITFGETVMAEINKIEAKTRKEAESKTARVLLRWLPERRQAGRKDPAKRTG